MNNRRTDRSGLRSLRFWQEPLLCSLLLAAGAGCAGSRNALQTTSPTTSADAHSSVASAETVSNNSELVTDCPEQAASTSLVNSPAESISLSEVPSADDHRSVTFENETIVQTAAEEYPVPAPVPVNSMTLADLEQLALEHNPTIKQANASANKAAGLYRQVGAKPNPTLGYSGSQLADESTDQHIAFVEQEIVLGDKLAKNRAVLSRAQQAQLWELESQRFRVLTDVRVEFYDVLAAQQKIALTEDFSQLTQKAVQISELRKKALEGSQIELLQAEIQKNEIDLLRQQAQFEYQAAWNELISTTGMPYLVPTPLAHDEKPDSSPQDWAGLYQALLVNSPELAAAQNRVAEAQANLDRQKVQAVPNLTVQLGAGVDNATNSGMINVQVGARIPVYNRNTGNISAAYADYCRATHEVDRIKLALKSRLARVAQEYDSARAGVQKYEQEILPKAQETLSLSEQAFDAGELNFLQILIVRKTYFESNLQFVQVQRDLAQAHAKIDGLLLTGALEEPADFRGDDSLRGQTFSGQ